MNENQFGKTREGICKGVAYIGELLWEIKKIVKDSESDYYDTPRFIFRGITKYYPEKGKPKKRKYTVEEVENGYIRSGQAIRMEATSSKFNLEKAYIRANYISGLQEMVYNARKHYPDKYGRDCTELDILADIQHNGGATCLVDFSKNLLTSLWFACSDEPRHDGFIYCYDVMKDMIENDALTYIREEDEKKTISQLLYATHRETNISSDVDARFYLWEPKPRNNRIMRQDSIFMFGIEKFHVKSHGIKVVRVPANTKRDILLAMKSLYNISSSTIYNDPVGFADNNAKTTLCQKMNDSAYNRGYLNMIKGNYYCALDFLKLWEGDNEGKLSHEENVELHFSLAVCYKNLRMTMDAPIYYAENAKEEYNKVIHNARHILNALKNDNPQKRAYYKLKCVRAFNGIIDMEYSTKNYLEAIDVSDTIIAEINDGILQPETVKEESVAIMKVKTLKPKYCRITKLEMLNLELLENWEKYNGKKNLHQLHSMMNKMQKFYKESKNQEDNTFFDKLLIQYYKELFEIITSEETLSLSDYIRHFVTYIDNPTKELGKQIYDGYILWNFIDIKDAIHRVKDSELLKKKALLLDVTAYAISFRDKFQMQSWGRSDNM